MQIQVEYARWRNGRKKTNMWSYRQLSCGFSTEFPLRKEYSHIFSVYRLRFEKNKRVIDFRSGIFLFPHHNSIVNDLSGVFFPLYSSSQLTCFQYLLLPKVNKCGVKLPVILAEESQKIMTPMIITELFFWYLMRSAWASILSKCVNAFNTHAIVKSKWHVI